MCARGRMSCAHVGQAASSAPQHASFNATLHQNDQAALLSGVDRRAFLPTNDSSPTILLCPILPASGAGNGVAGRACPTRRRGRPSVWGPLLAPGLAFLRCVQSPSIQIQAGGCWGLWRATGMQICVCLLRAVVRNRHRPAVLLENAQLENCPGHWASRMVPGLLPTSHPAHIML